MIEAGSASGKGGMVRDVASEGAVMAFMVIIPADSSNRTGGRDVDDGTEGKDGTRFFPFPLIPSFDDSLVSHIFH